MRTGTIVSCGFAALAALMVLAGATAAAELPATSPSGAPPGDKVVFKNYGFAIAPLDEAAKGGDTEVLRMCLSTGVVGVKVQPCAGTMEEYLARSKKDIEKNKGKVLTAKVDGDSMLLEYTGSPQGGNPHFYQRARLKAGTIFLTTAAAPDDKWKDVGAKLKACLDSLEVPPTAKAAGKLIFRKQGFAIAPLDEAFAAESATVLMMWLPAVNGDSPNVNVRLIRFEGRIEDYAAQNWNGLHDDGCKITGNEIERGGWTVEFTRLSGDRTFHGYQRAMLKAGTVSLATAVAPEDLWNDAAPKLKTCVDSLELLPGAKPTTAAAGPTPAPGTGGGPVTKQKNGEIAFSSTSALQVWIVHTEDLPGAEDSFARLGVCPGAKPIRIPAGANWLVIPAEGTTVEALAAEVRARGIPGLGLAQARDDDLVHLKGLKALKTLALSRTDITDAGLENLKELKEVQWLDLTCARVSDAGLAQFKDWKNLQTLNLDNTQVSGSGLVHLKNLAALRTLRLMDAPVTDAGLAGLKGLKALQVLDLQNDNHDSQVTDAGLANLKELKTLRALDLTGVPLTDVGLAALKDLTKLEMLGLSRTKITDAGLVNLRRLQGLKLLGLYDTAISPAGIAELKKILPHTDILRQMHAVPVPE